MAPALENVFIGYDNEIRRENKLSKCDAFLRPNKLISFIAFIQQIGMRNTNGTNKITNIWKTHVNHPTNAQKRWHNKTRITPILMTFFALTLGDHHLIKIFSRAEKKRKKIHSLTTRIKFRWWFLLFYFFLFCLPPLKSIKPPTHKLCSISPTFSSFSSLCCPIAAG